MSSATVAGGIKSLRVAFASGGSGGHLYPGLAVAQEMQSRDAGAAAMFFTSEKAVEAEIVQRNGFPACAVPSCVPRWNRLPDFLSKLNEGYRVSRKALETFRPDALLALGGFASFAPALAARRLGIPVFVQEQNSVAGRANLLLSLLARRVFTPYRGMRRQFPLSRVCATGNPMRKAAVAAPRVAARKALGLDADRFTLLLLGGSQGAHFLNDIALRGLDGMSAHRERMQVLHLTGKNDARSVQQAYKDRGWKAVVFDYHESMGDCYGACDLVISRAGASTLSEILGNGLASILIPYPSAMRDHQRKNARILANAGAALLLEETLLTPGAFSSAILSLHRDARRLDRMRDAAKKLYPGNAAYAIAEELAKTLQAAAGAGR